MIPDLSDVPPSLFIVMERDIRMYSNIQKQLVNWKSNSGGTKCDDIDSDSDDDDDDSDYDRDDDGNDASCHDDDDDDDDGGDDDN
jgi:hypothetical protein